MNYIKINNIMRGFGIIIVLMQMIFTIGVIFVIFWIGSIFLETKQEYKDKLNTEYVMDKDTLTVIDYSMLNSNFTLSNGARVSSTIIFKDALK